MTFRYLEEKNGSLYWGPLTKGTLLRRYKRFLVDVRLDSGEEITAHTNNTGRMTGCSEPGRPVWLSRHDKPGRKHLFTFEMISMPSSLVGINTSVPNKLAAAAARAGLIAEFPKNAKLTPEFSIGQSRLDLKLEEEDGSELFVEIKNCTLVENGRAFFPDAVTARGLKHLHELSSLVKPKSRAMIFILIQRGDAESFSPADHIDPQWGKALRQAYKSGVEILAYKAELNLEKISLSNRIPVKI